MSKALKVAEIIKIAFHVYDYDDGDSSSFGNYYTVNEKMYDSCIGCLKEKYPNSWVYLECKKYGHGEIPSDYNIAKHQFPCKK